MKINSINNNQSFKALRVNIEPQKLKSEEFVKELFKIKKIFEKNKFDKKKWVNVILTHDDYKGFFGIIESKKQGVPMNPYYSHPITTSKKDVKAFKKWLDEWNHSYSPSALAAMKRIKEAAVECMQKEKDMKRHILSFWHV